MGSSSHATLATLALLAFGSLASCSGSSGSSHSTTTTSWTFSEVEINDTALTANIAGDLYVGDHYTIFGHTTDNGFDPFDGFAFFPQQSLELEFSLTPTDPAAVLEICLVAPFGGPPPVCWNTTMTSGVGFLTIAPGQEVHLVISSLWGATDYRLEVAGYPPVYAATSATGGATAEGALLEHLGDYLAGAAPGPQASTVPPETAAPLGALVVLDAAGALHSYPLGIDEQGPFVDVGARSMR